MAIKISNSTIIDDSRNIINAKNVEVTGVSTFTDNVFVGSGITFHASTGIISATAFYGSGSNILDLIQNINGSKINGITVEDDGVVVGTFSSITKINFVGNDVIASGVGSTATVTFNTPTYSLSAGIATSVLTNPGVGIATAGGTVGTGATILDFRGSGISTVTVFAGIATINVSGGGGTIAITDDTSTNATYYVGIANTTTGNLSTLNVSSTKLTFNPSTGNLVAGGTVTANSDEKLKTNIKTIENALHKVLSLRGVEFDRIDTGDHQIGVVAQEVEKIIPEVVYPKQPAPDYETKSVAYANLIGLLIEAVKEQNQRIVELERKLEEK